MASINVATISGVYCIGIRLGVRFTCRGRDWDWGRSRDFIRGRDWVKCRG